MANVNIKVGYTVDKTGLNEIKKQLADIRVEAASAKMSGKLTDDLEKASKAATELENILNSAWNSKLGQLDLSKVNTGIKNTYGTVQNLQKALVQSGATGAAAYNNFARSVLNANIQLKETSQTLDKMATTFKNTIRYGISSSIFNNLSNSVKKAYDYTVKLDSSLNDIRVVTGKSAEEMDKFAIRANKVAKDLGRSTKDFTEASLIYYQQGLNDRESQARAEVTMKAANVTGQAGQEVSEQLTAVWNGYKVTAEETELYVDKLAAVAATTAADLEELSTGMSKVASAANIMGVDVDQLNAQLATIVSVTRQAPESVGVALKTIYARMSDIKSGLDDETTLGNYTSKMAQFGFNVLDANGNLRDMGDVIEEIGKKWTTMSREQQVALAQTVAGTRQYNNLLSLFDNWNMYTDALETSANAAGTLQKQQDIYMESTAAHLEQLATEAEKTYAILFDQDSIRGFIDLMQEALSLVNSYLNGLGGGMKTVATLGLQVSNIFSKQISESITRQLENSRIQEQAKDTAKIKEDIIANRGYNKETGLSLEQEAALNKEYEYAEKIASVRKALTSEEYKELTAQQAQIGKLEEQIKHYHEIEKEIDKIANKYNMILGTEDDFNAALEESADEAEQLDKMLKKLEHKNDTPESREDWGKNNQEYIDLLKQQGVEEKDIQATLDNEVVLRQRIESALESTRIKQEELRKGKKYINSLDEDELAQWQAQQNSLQSSINKTVELKNEQMRIQTIVRGTTTLLSTFASIQGIISTLGDDQLSGWEKFTQVMSVAAIQGVTLLSGFKEIKNLLPAIAVELAAIESTQEAITAFQKEGLVYQIATIANKLKEVAIDKIRFAWEMAINLLTGKSVTAIGIAVVAGFAAATIALGVWVAKIIDANSAETKLKESIESTKQAVEDATEAYNELKDTVSTYTDAKKAIDDLEEGTVEFYEAIQKANKAAQELIDTWGLVVGQDYVLNSNGLININPETLQNKQFQAQQEVYRAQAQNYAARANYIRQSSKNGLSGFYDRFAASINRQFAINGVSGYRISANQAEAISKGQPISNSINAQLQKIDTNTQKLDKTFSTSIDKVPTKINESARKDTIDITDTVKQFKNDYNRLTAQARSLDYQTADATIRGYGTKSQVDRYNAMSGTQQNVAQQYILRRQAEQASQNTVRDTDFFGNISAGAIGGAAAGSTFLGIGAIPGALAGGLGGLIGSLFQQGQIDKFYREEYLKSTKGYQQDASGQWTNSFGSIISDDQIKKDLDAIDLEIAKSAYQRGESITKAAYADFENKLDKNIDSVISVAGENGESRFNANSAQYLGSAITAAQEGLNFDYSILGENELSYLKENIDSLNVSTEVYNTILETTSNTAKRLNADLQEYNSILKTQAEELGTTTSALELYGYAMQNAGEITGDLNKQTAEAIVSSYKFNKAFNDAQKSYLDNKDALDLYSKALEDHEDISYDVADAVGDLKDKVEDMFDGAVISSKVFSKNLSLIETLLTGTQEEADAAYNTLSRMLQENALVDTFGAASDALFRLEYDNDKVCTSIMTSTQALYEGLINAIDNTNPGEKLNADFAGQLAAMINNADMTVAQIQALADSLNLDIPMEISTNADDITIETAKWTAGAQVVQHSYQGEAPDPKDPSKNVKVKYAWTETIEDKTEEFGIPVVKGDQIKVRDNARSNGGGNRGTRRNFTPSMGNIGSGKKGGSGGSGSSKEPDKMDPLEKEIDRYHDVDIELKQISTDMDKIDKQKKKLFGKDLISNINKQLKLLDQQIEVTNRKIQVAQQEAGELQNKLSAKGVSFNVDGTIANYASAYAAQLNYVNGLINKYNSMSAEAQESYKETVEQAKEDFDKFVDNLSRYDEVVTSLIPDLESDIQDAIDKKIDLQIEEFDMEIEIRLNLAEAERDWNEFKKKIIDDIAEDDILGNAMAKLVDFSSYYKEDNTGIIQALRQQVDNTLAELNKMDKTGQSSVYGDNRSAALEDLQKYYQELMTNLSDVADLQKDIHDSYMEMMDEAQDKFDEQIESYEMISALIEHDMKVISLVYGEESYSQLAKYYDRQQQNFNSQLNFQKQQVTFWQQQLDALEKGSDAWENAKEKWASAVKELNDLIESSIQNLQDKYLNTINLIFYNLNNRLTDNLGLEYIEEEWNLINKNADQYLDTVNSVYEIQKLENKYLKSLDDVDSLGMRRQLQDIMNEELAALREKDKLTQYDVERANKRYEIALKQIALQEAQQNKTKMRLRRDSQGNYRYEYTSDADQVNQLQNEIDDMYNSLYNFDKSRYQENLNQLYSVWKEFQEKMAEAAQINDPLARSERELLLQDEYGKLINGIVEENTIIRTNLYNSAFDDLSRLYEEDNDKVQELANTEKDILMNDLIPYWDSGVQHMMDVFAGEGGFLETCKDSFEELDNATKEYEQALNKLEETGVIDFENLEAGIDENIDKTQTLIKNNQELINSYKKELDAINNVIDQLDTLVTKYNAAKKAAIEATEAAYKYWQEQQRQAAASANKATTTATSTPATTTTTSTPKATTTTNSSSSGGGDGVPRVGDVVNFNSGKYTADSYGGGASGSKGLGGKVKITIVKNDGRARPIHIATTSGGALGWVSLNQISGYDTGGYTGAWGNNGRLALLHQKELVLNQEDTKNMLNAVTIMRNITDMLGSTVLSKLAAATAGNVNTSTNSDILEQNVHIDAQFPNVTNSREIEEALNNLVNMASMRANKR